MKGATTPAPLANLAIRAAVLRSIRAFFEARGSLEVDTPLLVSCPGLDCFVDAPAATVLGRRRWLATSPEHAMKRLLAAGSGPIHQLAAAFRDGEVGRLHEPQFTLLEWYELGVDDAGCMDTTEALVRILAAEHGGGCLRSSLSAQPLGAAPFRRLPFADAFALATGEDAAAPDARRLGRLLRAAGLRPPGDATAEDLVDLALGAVLPRALADGGPTFVTDWPPSRAALARLRPGPRGPVAARFELYAGGIELCNGYHELTDAAEQRARMEAENARRVARGAEPYPVDEALLAALPAVPDCAGNALGVDRLLLLLLGESDLSAVRAFRLE